MTGGARHLPRHQSGCWRGKWPEQSQGASGPFSVKPGRTDHWRLRERDWPVDGRPRRWGGAGVSKPEVTQVVFDHLRLVADPEYLERAAAKLAQRPGSVVRVTTMPAHDGSHLPASWSHGAQPCAPVGRRREKNLPEGLPRRGSPRAAGDGRGTAVTKRGKPKSRETEPRIPTPEEEDGQALVGDILIRIHAPARAAD